MNLLAITLIGFVVLLGASAKKCPIRYMKGKQLKKFGNLNSLINTN